MTDDDRRPHTNTRINDPTHARLKAHNRDSETLSATIDRALDALEREDDLPDAVTAAMRGHRLAGADPEGVPAEAARDDNGEAVFDGDGSDE